MFISFKRKPLNKLHFTYHIINIIIHSPTSITVGHSPLFSMLIPTLLCHSYQDLPMMAAMSSVHVASARPTFFLQVLGIMPSAHLGSTFCQISFTTRSLPFYTCLHHAMLSVLFELHNLFFHNQYLTQSYSLTFREARSFWKPVSKYCQKPKNRSVVPRGVVVPSNLVAEVWKPHYVKYKISY